MRVRMLLVVVFCFLGSCMIRPHEGQSEEVDSVEGPIRASERDPRYFEYKGEPIVLITSAEHYGAVLNLDFDYVRYLDTLQADGLNYTRAFTGSYVEREGSFGIKNNSLAPAKEKLIAPWTRSDQPGYIHGGNKFDLNQWDPAYFERLHDFLSKAEERGIIVEITLFSSIYSDAYWQFSPLHPNNNVNYAEPIPHTRVNTLDNGPILAVQERMVRKLVRELNQHNNFFFEIQNEPYADHPETTIPINPFLQDWRENWMNRVDLATRESLDWQDKIAEIITSEESSLPQKHLIAQNFCNFRYRLNRISERISIMNFHYAYPEAVTWNYYRNKIAGFDESGFSGSDDDVYRRQAWRFILAGGAIFNNLDYSFYPGFEDGTGPNEAPGGGGPALRKQLKVLKDFIHDLPFTNMGPNDSIVRMAPGANIQGLSAHGLAYAIFIESVQDTVALTLNLRGAGYRAEWIDTRTGEVLKQESIENPWRPVVQSPPFDGDIALKITYPPEE
ncbi:MAG: hypothetical protein JSU96_09420 [Acidobacteriota bacterium]|nr:MAG: hypothetical protein JSU96_09420 [Acidobacteriota bacterium]